LGTMALTKRGGGRVLGVKVEPAFVPVPVPVSGANAPSVDADGAPDAKSSSSSSSSGSGAGGASSGPALSTSQTDDESLQIDGDVPCSPSSRAAGRDSSLAQRAAALAVGLVSAGASDIISRWGTSVFFIHLLILSIL
jgi:hypothetical protein